MRTSFKTNPFEPSAPPSPPADSSDKSQGKSVMRRLSAALWPIDNRNNKSQKVQKNDDALVPSSRSHSFSSIRSENLGPLDGSCKEHENNFERSLLGGHQSPVAV